MILKGTAMIKSILSLFLLLSLSACFDVESPIVLKNTHWGLTQIKGDDSENIAHQPEAHLVFHLNDKSFHGSDGCNRIHGTYVQEKDHFSFSNVITTKMYCKEGMEQGQDFLLQLEKTNGAKMMDDVLIFFRNNKELLRFIEQENF